MDIKIDFSKYSKADFDELAKKHGLTMEELEAAIDDAIEERCEYIACTPIDKGEVKLRIKGSIVPGSFFVHNREYFTSLILRTRKRLNEMLSGLSCKDI